ncbi:MAG TPA: SRPBCC family protein [Pyrinomonadaceae bacterium]|nr:SRPBCC family protein [Pyrinomonadaceae bacterium]
MTILMDDQSVAQRILDHIEHRTTDLGQSIWREPVANYRSEERMTAEVELAFRRSPTPFCPSAALPDVGCYVARDAAGTPLLAVRAQDGTVRAFRNACRHRGTQLAAGSGCAKAFVCPYHGWTYTLEGRLRGVPDDYGFPDLDKELHGLVPVDVSERFGLVFVTQDEPRLTDSSLDQLPELIAPEQRLIGTKESEITANWKIMLEGFLEGYHIRSTHRETFYPYGFDNLNVVEVFGRNSRVTYPFRRIAKLVETPPADRRVEGLLTYVYHLFPNVVVTVLSHHTNLIVLEPVALDMTKLITYRLTNRGSSSTPELRETVERDAEFVDQTGAAEDRAVVRSIQCGLGSGANRVFTFGLFESAIAHFHRSLDAILEQATQR